MAESLQVLWPIADLHREARRDGMRVSQALSGEGVEILSAHEGWARVRLQADGYEGFMQEEALGKAPSPTHRLMVPASHIYPEANIKSAPVVEAYLGCGLAVAGREGNFLKLAGGGFIIAAHVERQHADPASIAAQFLHVPYLWGGKSMRGLDCSGLIQLALAACGMKAPRDSGPQSESLGVALPQAAALKRNDLVFWKGHVGILTAPGLLLHANAFHMQVVEESLAGAIARIGAPSVIRRLQ